MKPLRSLGTLGLCAAVLLACENSEEIGSSPEVRTDIALLEVESCEDLEQYIEDTLVQEMRVQLDAWNDPSNFVSTDEASAAPNAAPAAGRGAADSAAPQDFTRTNTQVDGVDEADFVKTDGTRIFVLSGRKLYVARSWPPQDLSVVDTLEIQGWPLEMFLDEAGRIIVFSSWWPNQQARDDVYCGPWGCGSQETYTRVTVIDSSNNRLQVQRELFFPGSYVSSRRIGDSTRLVLRERLGRVEGVDYWPRGFRGDPERDPEGFRAALEELKNRNEARIRSASLADWLPQAYVESAGSRQTIERDCQRFRRPNAPVHLGLTTVATLNLQPSFPSVDRLSILGEVGEIYASRASLYLASPHWWWFPRAGQTTHTYLHKFDIQNPSRAVYVGSGGVPGYLLDQFSMDEHMGYLRVATTVEERVRERDWWTRSTSNRVGVLGVSGGRLVEVGAVTGLAPTEQIMSARFVDNRGFVVTFEQIDPLFTLDLSNPFDPQVIGELKVPGFSSYIHPLDENHLLTIGVHLPEPDPSGRVAWQQRSVKLTVFDVTNFAQPREKFTQLVGTAYGWSEANWNHKAFNWFPARKMLAIPFADYRPGHRNYWEHFVSDLRLFEVDTQTGIQSRGTVDLSDVYIYHSYQNWSWSYSPWVRRSVMADDYAYAISDAGIRVADMRQPDQTIATALFDTIRLD